jgi:tRNA(Ile)-lysidine synthase
VHHPPSAADTLLVAISGGADSTALVHWLAGRLVLPLPAPPRAGRLVLLHVNHGLRGDDSAADEVFCRALAESLALPIDVHHPPPLPDGNEADWRRQRLEAIAASTARHGATVVVTGHHADDAAESFLLMALRGSGPAGLGSIAAPSPRLWRPLLPLTAAAIRAALRDAGLSWREDTTNTSPRHRRNRLRHEAIPLLETIAPGAAAGLARAARHCAAVDHAAELLATRAAAAMRLAAPHPLVPIAPLLADGPAVAALLLRALVRAAGHTTLPATALIDAALATLQRPNREDARLELLPGCWLHASRRHLLLAPSADAAVWHEVAGALPWPLADRVEARVVLLPPGAPLPGTDPAARLELPADLDPSGLRWAPVDPGARLQLPRGGSKSAADALREAGVPAPLRPLVAGLYLGDRLVWIPRVRRCAAAPAPALGAPRLVVSIA